MCVFLCARLVELLKSACARVTVVHVDTPYADIMCVNPNTHTNVDEKTSSLKTGDSRFIHGGFLSANANSII